MSNVGIGKAFTGVFVAITALVVVLVVTHSRAPKYDTQATFRTENLHTTTKEPPP